MKTFRFTPIGKSSMKDFCICSGNNGNKKQATKIKRLENSYYERLSSSMSASYQRSVLFRRPSKSSKMSSSVKARQKAFDDLISKDSTNTCDTDTNSDFDSISEDTFFDSISEDIYFDSYSQETIFDDEVGNSSGNDGDSLNEGKMDSSINEIEEKSSATTNNVADYIQREKAATTIQACVRFLLKRQKKSLLIQSHWRRSVVQQRYQREKAVLKIQACLRRFLLTRHKKSLLIQSHWRRFLVQQRYQQEKEAVLKIQNAVRRYSSAMCAKLLTLEKQLQQIEDQKKEEICAIQKSKENMKEQLLSSQQEPKKQEYFDSNKITIVEEIIEKQLEEMEIYKSLKSRFELAIEAQEKKHLEIKSMNSQLCKSRQMVEDEISKAFEQQKNINNICTTLQRKLTNRNTIIRTVKVNARNLQRGKKKLQRCISKIEKRLNRTNARKNGCTNSVLPVVKAIIERGLPTEAFK